MRESASLWAEVCDRHQSKDLIKNISNFKDGMEKSVFALGKRFESRKGQETQPLEKLNPQTQFGLDKQQEVGQSGHL